MGWIASIEQIEALNPSIVVAGHKRPDARDDDPAAILGGTKTYIRDFELSLSGSHSAQELVDKMMVLHGDRGNPTHCGQQLRASSSQDREHRHEQARAPACSCADRVIRWPTALAVLGVALARGQS
jgi:hypothetical protein